MGSDIPSVETLVQGCPAPLARISRTGEFLSTNPSWEAWLGAFPLLDRVRSVDRSTLASALAEGGAKVLDVQLEMGSAPAYARLSLWAADEGSMWVLAEPGRHADEERKARILVDCFRVMDASVWSCDLTGKILVSDGAGLKHLGLVPGQLVGMNIHDLFPAESLLMGNVQRTLGGEAFSYEDVTEQANWLNVYAPLRDATDRVLGLEALSINFGKDMQLAKRAKAIADCVDKLPIMIWAIDKQGICTVLSGDLADAIGLSGDEIVGKNFFEFWKDRPEIGEDLQRALDGESHIVERSFGQRFTRSRYAPMIGPFGEILGACAATEDASAQKRVEEQLREQVDLIESQKRAIVELGTPIIEVWQDVLAVPIVGAIDPVRAEQMLAELLDMIVHRQARFAILDVTGVETMDTATAQHLVKVVEASRLLGCEGVITGIRPSVANTLVELGADLSQIRTLRSLKDALRFCAGLSARVRADRIK